MTDRYGEAVWAAVETDGRDTTQTIKNALSIGYNDAARFTERMVADGIISECDSVGRRTLLKNFCGTCEACAAPLFEDDDYLIDEGDSSICKPAVDIVGPCYADRVGGLDASADTRPEGGDSTKIEAPFTGGAVPEGQTPTPSSAQPGDSQ